MTPPLAIPLGIAIGRPPLVINAPGFCHGTLTAVGGRAGIA